MLPLLDIRAGSTYVRLYWGWQLVQSGWGKLHNLANVTDFFMSLNLPYPAQTAVFISCVEFFGGILLALGLLTRMTALVLTINMVVAYVTADHEALLGMYRALRRRTVASVIILLFGSGKLGLDALIRLRGAHALQEAPAASR